MRRHGGGRSPHGGRGQSPRGGAVSRRRAGGLATHAKHRDSHKWGIRLIRFLVSTNRSKFGQHLQRGIDLVQPVLAIFTRPRVWALRISLCLFQFSPQPDLKRFAHDFPFFQHCGASRPPWTTGLPTGRACGQPPQAVRQLPTAPRHLTRLRGQVCDLTTDALPPKPI